MKMTRRQVLILFAKSMLFSPILLQPQPVKAKDDPTQLKTSTVVVISDPIPKLWSELPQVGVEPPITQLTEYNLDRLRHRGRYDGDSYVIEKDEGQGAGFRTHKDFYDDVKFNLSFRYRTTPEEKMFAGMILGWDPDNPTHQGLLMIRPVDGSQSDPAGKNKGDLYLTSQKETSKDNWTGFNRDEGFYVQLYILPGFRDEGPFTKHTLGLYRRSGEYYVYYNGILIENQMSGKRGISPAGLRMDSTIGIGQVGAFVADSRYSVVAFEDISIDGNPIR